MSGRLTSEKLKILAMGTMFLDHAAAAIIFGSGLNETNPLMEYIGIAMRLVGRMAFPLYAFLLVQGFLWTRDWSRYVTRMVLFALISEVPFNLVISGEVWYSRTQNTIVTLIIGLICMRMLETLDRQFELTPGFVGVTVRPEAGGELAVSEIGGLSATPEAGGELSTPDFGGRRSCKEKNGRKRRDSEEERYAGTDGVGAGGKILGVALGIWTAAAAMFAAELMRTDYGALGVLLVVVLYVFRHRPSELVVAGCLAAALIYGFGLEVLFAWIAFFFISRYNGERGRKLGLMPYVFYPMHLLVVWLAGAMIREVLGM